MAPEIFAFSCTDTARPDFEKPTVPSFSSILSNFDNIPVGKHFNNYGIVKTNAKMASLLISYSFSFSNKTQFHFKSWSKIIPIASKKARTSFVKKF